MPGKETEALKNPRWCKAVVEEATAQVSRAAVTMGKGGICCLVADASGDRRCTNCGIKWLTVAAMLLYRRSSVA